MNTLDTVNCPSCGFPNMAGVRTCISCQSPLPHLEPPKEELGIGSKLRPFSTAQASQSGPAPIPVPLDDSPQNPGEILERIRQVRGEDALRSLEMLAIPGLREAADAELGTEGASPEAPGHLHPTAPPSAPSPPHRAQPLPAAGDPWMVDHHELRAVEAPDPWRARLSTHPGTPASDRKPSLRAGFRPVDLISGIGVLLLLGSLAMPWISVHGGTEGEALRPGSLPIALLVTGVSETYPLPWLTAFLVAAILAVMAATGLLMPRSQLAATGLTVAGLLAILTPAAFLVKFALSGETGSTGELVYVAAPGLYLALGAALVVLLGAALRGSSAAARKR